MARFHSLPSMPQWVTAGAWLLLGFSATAWVLYAQGGTKAVLATLPLAASRADPPTAAVALALGAATPGNTPLTSNGTTMDLSRFSLQGVIATGNGAGTALMAVDGKPAKPVVVGASVVDGVVLTRVESRSAWIAPAQTAKAAVPIQLVDSKKANTLSSGAPLVNAAVSTSLTPVSAPPTGITPAAVPGTVSLRGLASQGTEDKRKESDGAEGDPSRTPVPKTGLGGAALEMLKPMAARASATP